MPRGGARPGAGRKPKPKPEVIKPAGFTEPDGKRSAAAPADWPFGTKPPEAAPAPFAAPAAPPMRSSQAAHEFLKETYQDVSLDLRVRIQAAVAALPYEEAKYAPKAKKGEQEQSVPRPSKFGAMSAPKLVHSRT